MSSLVATVEPVQQAGERLQVRGSRRIQWLIFAGYVVGAFIVTWRIWANPAHVASNDGGQAINGDFLVDFWFLHYAATALAHGHLPSLVTSAVNYPQGINMMWNNTLLLAGVVLAPVTLLAGPIASLAILLTAGFAGSAAAMFVVLRRWGGSTGPAAIGGAVFGFCPALMVAAEDHYQLQFAVFVPLIIDAALRLITGTTARPVRTGVWLGVLVSLQIFIGEELLMFAALTGVVLVMVLAACRPSLLISRARQGLGAVKGAAVAGAIVAVTCGHALFIQLHGPLAEHGTPWHISRYGNHESAFFTAPLTVMLHPTKAEYLLYLRHTGIWIVENYAYLGWPILIAVLLIGVVFWRDLKIRVAFVTFVVIALCSMGGHRQYLFGVSLPAAAMPWHYLGTLPLIGQAVINRISILADGLAAVVIALAADRVVAAVRRQSDWRKPVLAAAACAALAAMIIPIIPRPVPAAADTPAPAGWTTVIDRLHLTSGAPVLVLPLDGASTMGWQAMTGVPITIVGGYCIAPTPAGKAAECQDAHVWTGTEKTAALHLMGLLADSRWGPPRYRTAARAIAQWHPAAILYYGPNNLLSQYLTRLLGPPTAQQGVVTGWRLGSPGKIPPPRPRKARQESQARTP